MEMKIAKALSFLCGTDNGNTVFVRMTFKDCLVAYYSDNRMYIVKESVEHVLVWRE